MIREKESRTAGLIKTFTSLNDIRGLMVGLSTNRWTVTENDQGERSMVLGVLVIQMIHLDGIDLSDSL